MNALTTQVNGDHYKKHKIQPIEYSHANNLNVFQSNIIKYATRYPDKSEEIDDLKKVIHYARLAALMQYGIEI